MKSSIKLERWAKMSLVRSNKKRTLERGPSFDPKKSFSLDDVTQTKEPAYVPEKTTIRVTTTIRDKINTLSLMGYADTQTEMIEKLIDHFLDNMGIDERRKYDIQYQVLDDRTRKSLKKKLQ